MSKNVICLCGKKMSGKDTAFEYIQTLIPDAESFRFADPIKRFSIDMLGLRQEQVYGSNEEKDTLTQYRWESLPIPYWVVPKKRPVNGYSKEVDTYDKEKHYLTLYPRQFEKTYGWLRTGFMTGREVVQYWATEIMRSVDSEIHVKRCAEAIEKSNCKVAVILDLRFRNELWYAKSQGWTTLRFTKTDFNDYHQSEVELDNLHSDYFTGSIDNQHMTLEEKNKHIRDYLIAWGFIS